MDYKDFRGKILLELEDFYGKDASVKIHKTYKNNDIEKYGVLIQFTDGGTDGIVPLIYLEGLYKYYTDGIMDIDSCMGEIINKREEFLNQHEEIKDMPAKIMEWECVRNNVYPVLLPEKNNKNLLKDLVTERLLDLAVIYIIRGKAADGSFTSVKIKNSMLAHYGISRKELHMQALSNVKKDGYSLYSFTKVFGGLTEDGAFTASIKETKSITDGIMYIMTNKAMFYGTAGILDSQWLYENTGGTSCYIIPSSVHELVFVADSGDIDQEELDMMVLEANSTVTANDEKLSDHCYYYDAERKETRIRK
ncbi:MAG: hypothetical protein HFH68_14445 [Lachnospiraceae bacterium]|nr:hypothetical protein [Lachnospiraceae bacterium]